MQELITAKSNIDHLLGLTDAQKNKEMERNIEAQRAHFGPTWPEVEGFREAPNKQFSVGSSYKKYATVATVALLAVLRLPQICFFQRNMESILTIGYLWRYYDYNNKYSHSLCEVK
jgi:hypothetical protein